METEGGQPPRPSVGSDITLAADGHERLVDHTVCNTPQPVATSTVTRPARKPDRLLHGPGTEGSYLDDTCLAVSSQESDRNPKSKRRPDEERSRVLQFDIGMNRSSLGLLPPEMMAGELSESLLHVSSSVADDSRRLETPSTTKIEKNLYQRMAVVNEPSFVDTPTPVIYRDTYPDTRQGNLPHLGQGQGNPVKMAAGGMLFGSPADLDMTVVDVEINEEELKEFDEEFSDIGDIDTTLAEDSPPGVCDLRTELMLAESSRIQDISSEPGIESDSVRFIDSIFLKPVGTLPPQQVRDPDESINFDASLRQRGERLSQFSAESSQLSAHSSQLTTHSSQLSANSSEQSVQSVIHKPQPLLATTQKASASAVDDDSGLLSDTSSHTSEQHSGTGHKQDASHPSPASLSALLVPYTPSPPTTIQDQSLFKESTTQDASHQSPASLSALLVPSTPPPPTTIRDQSLFKESTTKDASHQSPASLSALLVPSTPPPPSNIRDQSLFKESTTDVGSSTIVRDGRLSNSSLSWNHPRVTFGQNGESSMRKVLSTIDNVPDTPMVQESQRQKDWGDVLSVAAGGRHVHFNCHDLTSRGSVPENATDNLKVDSDSEDETDALNYPNFSQLEPSHSQTSDRISFNIFGSQNVPGSGSTDKDKLQSLEKNERQNESVFRPTFLPDPSAMGDNFDENPFDTSDGGFPNTDVFSASLGQQSFGGFTDGAGFPAASADDFDGAGFGDGEFMSIDKAMDLIAEDEKEIEKENRFVQPETLPDHNTTLGLPDSWKLSSVLDMAVPSWTPDASPQRMSMGTFIRSRSDALGSLDGFSTDRPSFGTNTIHTPPRNRKPVALLASSLSDISEVAGTSVRGTGVGSDVDVDAVGDRTLEAEDLETSQAGGNDGPSNEQSNNSVTNAIATTTAINLSTVSKLIASSSTEAKPEELAEMIIKMSNQLSSRLSKADVGKSDDSKKKQDTAKRNLFRQSNQGKGKDKVAGDDTMQSQQKGTAATSQRQSGMQGQPDGNSDQDLIQKSKLRTSISGSTQKNSFQHNLLPESVPSQSQSTTVPTLLTSQSLLTTSFATNYLSPTRHSRVTFSETEPRSSHSISFVSDQLNSDDGNPRLQSPSLVRDLFNASDVSPDSQQRLFSSTMFSDQSYMQDGDSKENRPPNNQESPLSTPLHTQTSEDRMLKSSTRSANLPRLTVSAPSEHQMPKVCCVGLAVSSLLPLKNPSDRWVFVHLKIADISIDGQLQDPDRFTPFDTRPRDLIEPHNSSLIQITFSPRVAGVYVARLEVVAGPAPTQENAEHTKTYVTLKATAEEPNLQISNESEQLAFGSLPWGSVTKRTIKVLNCGQAGIPVRLVIKSDTSSEQCFTFEEQNAADTSVISPSRPLNAPTVPATILNSLLPRSTSVAYPFTIIFKAPTRRSERMGHPEEFLALLDIELDTPSTQKLIKRCRMTATVGTLKLHAPTGLEVIEFQAPVGSSHSQTLPLRNAGNLPFYVSVEVTLWPDYFTVSPSRLRIEPGAQGDFSVTFRPSQTSNARFESLLLMSVQPGGSSYEISLCGEVQRPAPRPLPQSHPPTTHSPLMANKSFLAYGAVPVGECMVQRVTLQNVSDNDLKLRIKICGDTHAFYLTTQRTGLVLDAQEVMLRPGEEYGVLIAFTPSRISYFSGKLQFKSIQSGTKYAIALSGYSGRCRLVLEGVESGSPESYWTNLGPLTTDSFITIRATLRNTGNRSAYVKAVSFRDLGCRHRASESNLVIQPSELCIPAGSAECIAVFLKPSETDRAMCLDQNSIISTVAFFYGEEVMRQVYRLAVLSGVVQRELQLLETIDPVRRVDFNVHFPKEEQCADMCPPSSAYDTAFFYSTMSKKTLALIGEPEPEVPDSLIPAIPSIVISSTPAVRGPQITISSGRLSTVPATTRGNQGKSRRQSRLQSSDWCIIPAQITLTTSTNADLESTVSHVQLVNYSDRSLTFDLPTSHPVLAFTPEHGTVPTRSSVLINVSAYSSAFTRGILLPWRGSAFVTCEGQSQVLDVQVRENALPDNTHPTTLPPVASLAADTPLITITMPGHTPHAPDNRNQSHQTFAFPDTPTTRWSHITLQLTNVSEQTVKWRASSLAPPYINYTRSNSERNLCRPAYTVFRLSEQEGVLRPGHNTVITGDFQPQETGRYFQYWNVMAEGLPNHVPHYIRLKLDGQGKSEMTESSISTQSSDARREGSFNTTHPPRCRVSFQESNVYFEASAPNTKKVLKLRIQNKSSTSQKMEVIAPRPPFSTNHTQIEVLGRHYLSLPVTFSPRQPGVYQEIVKVKLTNGSIISACVHGTCT